MNSVKFRTEELVNLIVAVFQNGALYGHNAALIGSGLIFDPTFDPTVRDEILVDFESIGDVMTDPAALDSLIRNTRNDVLSKIVRIDGTIAIDIKPIIRMPVDAKNETIN